MIRATRTQGFALREMNCIKDELNIYIVDELDFAFYQGTLQCNECLKRHRRDWGQCLFTKII